MIERGFLGLLGTCGQPHEKLALREENGRRKEIVPGVSGGGRGGRGGSKTMTPGVF